MSTLKVNSIEPANLGSEDFFLSRSWVHFTAAGGTPAIGASGNVASLTDNGVGDFTINFATALTDANYAIAGAADSVTPNADDVRIQTLAASSARMIVQAGATKVDPGLCGVMVVR